MKELTFEEFCELPMEYVHGIAADWGAMRLYRNEEYGLQKELVTKRIRKGDIYSGWRDGEVGFFVDGDDREFKTVDQLYVGYMEKACGERSAA